jgi:hypothetical protein
MSAESHQKSYESALASRETLLALAGDVRNLVTIPQALFGIEITNTGTRLSGDITNGVACTYEHPITHVYSLYGEEVIRPGSLWFCSDQDVFDISTLRERIVCDQVGYGAEERTVEQFLQRIDGGLNMFPVVRTDVKGFTFDKENVLRQWALVEYRPPKESGVEDLNLHSGPLEFGINMILGINIIEATAWAAAIKSQRARFPQEPEDLC